MSEFCVYLTIYSGNKLPPFYIGSSSVDKVIAGYHGSVRSIKYGKQWASELKHNPHLFKTVIIQKFPSRKEALFKENSFHARLNVVRSSMYINQSTAAPNGCHGMDVAGKNNPMYGKTHPSKGKNRTHYNQTAESKAQRIRKLQDHNEKFWKSENPDAARLRELHSQLSAGENNGMYGRIGINNPNFGRKASDSERANKSKALTGKKKSADHVRKFSKVYKIERESDGTTFIGYSLSEFGRVIGAGAALLIYHFNHKKSFSNGYRIVENLGVSNDPSTRKLIDYLTL